MSYPIHDQEHMAIVMSFQHWRRYLEGATVFSNQENLERFMTQTSLNGRQSSLAVTTRSIRLSHLLSKGSPEPCRRTVAP